VGPRAGMDRRKISSPPAFDPGPSSPYTVAIPAGLPGPKTKLNLLYIRNQFVPRSKHFQHGFKNQSFNSISNKSRCLLSERYKTFNAKRAPCRIF